MLSAEECKTVEDIKIHLVSNLQKVVDLSADNNPWKQISGFKRSFCISAVYHNEKTGQYGFHVSEDPPLNNQFNLGTYTSMEELIDNVAKVYYKRWIQIKPVTFAVGEQIKCS